MITGLALFALLVDDYKNAMAFYCGKLGFKVTEDTQLEDKRWIRIKAPGGTGSEILLSLATDDLQKSTIGNQSGRRVLFFFHTDDLQSDYDLFRGRGIEFLETPREEVYGKVAVFKDLYGNRIDLIEPKKLS
jgi:predicted enzyme related to lactoylglutathione lyase